MPAPMTTTRNRPRVTLIDASVRIATVQSICRQGAARFRPDPGPAGDDQPGRWSSRLAPSLPPVPEIGDDDGLLRVEACGLCGTDHEQYTGALPAGFAVRPRPRDRRRRRGASARRAAARWGVSVGDRVAVEVFQSCRACAGVPAGEYRRCARHGMGDMYGFIPVDRGARPVGRLRRAPVPRPRLHAAAGAGRPRPGRRHAVQPARRGHPLGRDRARAPQPGDVVAVLGPGVRGLSACAAAKEAGAAFVMVTGVGAARRRAPGARGRRSAPTSPSTWPTTDPAPGAARRDRRRAGRRRRRRHRQGAGRLRARRSRSPAAGGTVVVAGTRGAAGDPRVLARPRRLQGAAHPRRARRRRRPPTGPRSTCWPRAATPSPTCPAAASASTAPRTWCEPWPARATACAGPRRHQAMSAAVIRHSPWN